MCFIVESSSMMIRDNLGSSSAHCDLRPDFEVWELLQLWKLSLTSALMLNTLYNVHVPYRKMLQLQTSLLYMYHYILVPGHAVEEAERLCISCFTSSPWENSFSFLLSCQSTFFVPRCSAFRQTLFPALCSTANILLKILFLFLNRHPLHLDNFFCIFGTKAWWCITMVLKIGTCAPIQI